MWIFKSRKISSLDQVPSKAIGFVYKITDSNGKIYVGQKSLFSNRKKNFGKRKLAEISDKRTKKYEIISKESNSAG